MTVSNHLPTKKTPTIIAAHTFCNQCGVHIFRAPDSRKNTLEVNANCLDSTKKGKSNLDNLKISFYESETKLGSGKAIIDQWNDNIQQPPSQKYFATTTLLATGTESTAVVSNSSQSLSSEPNRADQESVSMDSASQDSGGMVYNSGYGISAWAVGSSLRSSPVKIEAPITSSEAKNRSVSTPSKESTIHEPMLQHQLKYYMKRHLSPSKSEGGGIQ